MGSVSFWSEMGWGVCKSLEMLDVWLELEEVSDEVAGDEIGVWSRRGPEVFILPLTDGDRWDSTVVAHTGLPRGLSGGEARLERCERDQIVSTPAALPRLQIGSLQAQG